MVIEIMRKMSEYTMMVLMLSLTLFTGITSDCIASDRITVFSNGREGYIERVSTSTFKEPGFASNGEYNMIIPIGPKDGSYRVVFKQSKTKWHVTELDKEKLTLSLLRTLDFEIPAMGVSVISFVSRKEPKALVGMVVKQLKGKGWRMNNTGQSWKSMTNGDHAIDIHCFPTQTGSRGVLWMQYAVHGVNQ